MASDWDVYLSCCSEHGEKDAGGVSSSRGGGTWLLLAWGSREEALEHKTRSRQLEVCRGGKQCLTHPTGHEGYV